MRHRRRVLYGKTSYEFIPQASMLSHCLVGTLRMHVHLDDVRSYTSRGCHSMSPYCTVSRIAFSNDYVSL